MRGKKIFTTMTNLALDKANGAYIYNFPNNNSLPGYKELGWTIKQSGISSLYLGLRKHVILASKTEQKIPKDYLKWSFFEPEFGKYFYTEKYGINLLLKKEKTRFKAYEP